VAGEVFTETIDLLAERWRAAGPLLRGFGLLAEGKPLSIDQLAAGTGVEVARLRKLLVSVRSEFDEEGRLVDLFGMTLEQTQHRLEIGSNVVFSCCALWAHVIPKLINRSVAVHSTDPVSKELVHLLVSPESIESVEPVHAMATMAVANARDIAADVCAAFCCQVKHFVSRENAELFASGSSRRSVVTVGELHELGADFYRVILSGLHE
jgi:alkylmercury lyase